jgi:4-hydroxy-tetrahydrodipicolinate reductase
MAIRICLAGATGWAGSELAHGIAAADDLSLVAGVSRTHAGRALGDVIGGPRLECPLYASSTEALENPSDVFVEYTKPDVAKANVMNALERGAHVVIGTSGLTGADFADIDAVAREQNLGVLACGNFALPVVLLQHFAEIAARYIPTWEIIDYAREDKIDSPSGTARELADRLAEVRRPQVAVSLEDTLGDRDARGATISGVQVHSVRLPGYVISAEIIFGMPDQKLTLRHDAGSSARPYVDGALLAIRKVSTLTGLHRGLDSVLEL